MDIRLKQLSYSAMLNFFKANNILVDTDDVAYIASISTNWNLLVREQDTRVTAWVDGRNVYLHRVILDCPETLVVDHINGNCLDNRKVNLRICTQAENTRNRSPNRGKEFKGISQRPCGKWRTRITAYGYTVHVGDFNLQEEAVAAYNRYAKLLHADYAKLNITKD